MCLFEEILENIGQIVNDNKIFDNGYSIVSTETISYPSYSPICNDLYNVIKKIMKELYFSSVFIGNEGGIHF